VFHPQILWLIATEQNYDNTLGEQDCQQADLYAWNDSHPASK
jgi:hypothetical protein